MRGTNLPFFNLICITVFVSVCFLISISRVCLEDLPFCCNGSGVFLQSKPGSCEPPPEPADRDGGDEFPVCSSKAVMMDRPAANGLLSPERRATAGGGWGGSGPHMSPIFARLCWTPTLNGNASLEQSSMGPHKGPRHVCTSSSCRL